MIKSLSHGVKLIETPLVQYFHELFPKNLNFSIQIDSDGLGITLVKAGIGGVGKLGKLGFQSVGKVAQAPLGIPGTIVRGFGSQLGIRPLARFGNWLCQGGGTLYEAIGNKPGSSIDSVTSSLAASSPLRVRELSVSLNVGKIDFLATAAFVQRQLYVEKKRWDLLQNLPPIPRILTYVGWRVTKVQQHVQKVIEQNLLKASGVNITVKEITEPPVKAQEKAIPLESLGMPRENARLLIEPSYIVEPTISELEGPIINSESGNIIQMPNESGGIRQNEVSEQLSLIPFPTLSQIEIYENSGRIVRGVETDFNKTPFSKLGVFLDADLYKERFLKETANVGTDPLLKVYYSKGSVITGFSFLVGSGLIFLLITVILKQVRRLILYILTLLAKKQTKDRDRDNLGEELDADPLSKLRNLSNKKKIT